ncbi:SDR family oxidoreductase [Kordiimonas sp. SCSIO 12610]|uniref:SDR family oxidoreductase n=1 Tax=Kordiimonas sp. SCSIO 12610 TaxID=2829597 RepID=UPI00210A43BC|nr:SDR family oxidoreductase [Kordiimonas sp. SCSIO 12610]UTW54467.1 SDR family oxidoreductase [Kordiimonas sp. SCSIO 12610]
MTRKKLNRRELLAGTAAIAATTSFTANSAVFADSQDLTGKSILITGCSSGFGRLGAEYYARRGAKVFATMRNLPRPEADELANVAKKDNLDIEIIEIDVLSEESIEAGVNRALKSAGGTIDVLINNAGIGVTGPVEVQDMAATELIFSTNVFGPQRMIRALLPSMRKAQSGQIFNISSQLGRVILPSAGHYSATKFALEALSEQLAYELVPYGIDITIIEPGGYPTQIWSKRVNYNKELLERMPEEQKKAYAPFIERMTADGGGGNTNPIDIPRNITEIIMMPKGERPLRRPVHPTYIPQTKINQASADAQIEMLGSSPFGPWVKSVLT